MDPYKLAIVFYVMLGAFALWAIWLANRPTRKIDGGREYKSTIIRKMDKRFNENAEFCPYCYTNDYFYRGGGSWSPDRCPYHPKSDDFILWKQMDFVQRNIAADKFKRMWKEMHGTEFKFTVYED